MKKKRILFGLIAIGISLYMSGCMELMPKEKQTFRTRGKGVYQGFDHGPEDYTAEQAKRDGCVVYRDTKLVDGGEYWEQFLRSAESKEPAKVRIMYQFGREKDEKEKNPVWADRNRNQFVYEWVHGTDAEGEADVSDKRKRGLSRI